MSAQQFVEILDEENEEDDLRTIPSVSDTPPSPSVTSNTTRMDASLVKQPQRSAFAPEVGTRTPSNSNMEKSSRKSKIKSTSRGTYRTLVDESDEEDAIYEPLDSSSSVVPHSSAEQVEQRIRPELGDGRLQATATSRSSLSEEERTDSLLRRIAEDHQPVPADEPTFPSFRSAQQQQPVDLRSPSSSSSSHDVESEHNFANAPGYLSSDLGSHSDATVDLKSKISRKQRLAQKRAEALAGGEFILYKRRWLMLLVFCSATFAGPFFQMSYAAIANVVHDWYQVSYLQVNLLAMAYMFCAIPFTFVASFLLEKVGVRLTIILGLALFVISGWLRFYATGPNDYWIALFGQTIGAIAQIFVGINVSLPMAINWFGDAERVVATTVGLMFNISGTGVSYALLPSLVPTGAALRDVMFMEAVYVSAVAAVVVLVFRERPPSPPSYAAKISAELMITNIEKVIDEESRLTAGFQSVLLDEEGESKYAGVGEYDDDDDDQADDHSSLYGDVYDYDTDESQLLSRSQAAAIVVTPPPSNSSNAPREQRRLQEKPLLAGQSSSGGYGSIESHVSASSLPDIGNAGPLPPDHPQTLNPASRMYESEPVAPNQAPPPQARSKTNTFFQNVRESVRSYSFVLLLLSFSVLYGSFSAIATLANQILIPEGYTSEEAGSIGATLIGTGLFSSILVGYLVDRTREYRLLMWSGMIASSIGLWWFTAFLRPGMYGMVILGAAMFGGFGMAMMPVSMDLAVELTYPVPGGTSSGLMFILATASCITLILIMNALTSPDGGMRYSVLCIACIWLVAALLTFFIKYKYKRLEAEAEQQALRGEEGAFSEVEDDLGDSSDSEAGLYDAFSDEDDLPPMHPSSHSAAPPRISELPVGSFGLGASSMLVPQLAVIGSPGYMSGLEANYSRYTAQTPVPRSSRQSSVVDTRRRRATESHVDYATAPESLSSFVEQFPSLYQDPVTSIGVWLDSPTSSIDNYSAVYNTGVRDDSSVRRLLDATNVHRPPSNLGAPQVSPIVASGRAGGEQLTRPRSHSDHGSFNAADFAVLSSTPAAFTFVDGGPAAHSRVPQHTPAPALDVSTDEELMSRHSPIEETDDLYSVTSVCRDFSSMTKGQGH